jgi:hypothetical protein
MKFIATLLQKFKPLPRPLGRWRTENCDTQLKNKIDLSNEDHCGPCGQYALGKQDLKKTVNLTKEDHINTKT